ncbi:MAG: ATP-binding protein, partial [Algiphilus sp.]|uniref:ATP-binding protein n=1 Tax=Algiphilus sp. TaxID=1872431 RepID=UPI0032EE156A
DFNNLLTVIMGNTELLIEDIARDDPRRELAELTHMAASRGAELTHRLLAFARRQALEPQPLDVAGALGRMRGLLGRTLREGITLECHSAPGTAAAFVDPAQFEAALLNLALNAQDAMPEGGRLAIEAAEAVVEANQAAHERDLVPGRYVCVVVSDTGRGISPEHRELVFEPFFTTKEVGRGTGLGLSMVYGFVRQSGGHIVLESEPGAGTRVLLYLPPA